MFINLLVVCLCIIEKIGLVQISLVFGVIQYKYNNSTSPKKKQLIKIGKLKLENVCSYLVRNKLHKQIDKFRKVKSYFRGISTNFQYFLISLYIICRNVKRLRRSKFLTQNFPLSIVSKISKIFKQDIIFVPM